MFLFYLEIEHKIRWDRYQFLNLPAASSNHVGGAILSLLTVYSPQFSNVVKFILKIWKTVVQACKLLKSLSKKPWGSSKGIFNYSLFLSTSTTSIYASDKKCIRKVFMHSIKLGIEHPGIDALMPRHTRTLDMRYIYTMNNTLLTITLINAHQDNTTPWNTVVLKAETVFYDISFTL